MSQDGEIPAESALFDDGLITESSLDEVIAAYSEEQRPHAPRDDSRLESPVSAALRAARTLAGKNPVGAVEALQGALAAQPGANSPAFTELARLVSPLADLPAVADVRDAARPTEDIPDVQFTPPLARALRQSWKYWHKPDLFQAHDYVTAILLSADKPLYSFLDAADISLGDLRDRWFAFVARDATLGSRTTWEAWWREAGVPLPHERVTLAGYLAESTTGEDQLGIDGEAQAFARLILDRNIEPPLSIGLLGDWGSGKSFFMERIRATIEALSQTPGTAHCGRVVQIRFNAWHLSDTNLWASLVTHIFDNIWQKVAPGETRTRAQAREALRRELDKANGAVHEAESRVTEAEQALERAEKAYDDKRSALAFDELVADTTRHALNAAARNAGWSPALDAFEDVEEAMSRLSSPGKKARLFASSALRGGARWRTACFLALMVLLGLGSGVASMFSGVAWLQDFAEGLGMLVGGIGTLGGLLINGYKRIKPFLDALQTARERYEDELRKRLEASRSAPDGSPIADEDLKCARNVAEARRILARSKTELDEARERLVALRQEQALQDPARRVRAFVEERVRADTYKSRQGIISLVRRDFEELSALMRDWREGRKQTPEGLVPVDRIVLYIDDLDRCSPIYVVQALEAIHLLLALDLFVVIVAVDTRWLLRSIELHYRELLSTDSDNGNDNALRSSTPQNYLEKIFQITYALAPMTESGFKQYVGHLTRVRDAHGAVAHKSDPPGRMAGASQPARDGGDEDEIAAEPGADTGMSGAGPDPMQPPGHHHDHGAGSSGDRSAHPRSAPRPLVICDAERIFLENLAPLVPTPRIAKRIVNVFRLIKASVPVEDIAAFEDASKGRHRAVLVLLAVLYGQPALAKELFRRLYEDDWPDKSDGSLIGRIRALEQRTEASDTERAAWRTLAGHLSRVAPDLTVAACKREIATLARYSLVTGQEWHRWQELPPLYAGASRR